MIYLCFLILSLSLSGQVSDAEPASPSAEDTLELIESILAQAESYLGVPYVYGGADENGFDCSGLTYRVFNDHGIPLPRTASAVETVGEFVERDSLQPGDIMIFHNPTHAGIYMGEGLFIHCSSWQDRGVVITPIDQPNYLRRYHTARRVIPAE